MKDRIKEIYTQITQTSIEYAKKCINNCSELKNETDETKNKYISFAAAVLATYKLEKLIKKINK